MKTILIALSLLFTGALHAQGHPKDSVSIHIISPTEKDSIHMGDSVYITADITSNQPLHTISITVKSADNMIVFYTDNIHTHSSNYRLNKGFIQTVKIRMEMVLEIKTSDHNGVTTSYSKRVFYSDRKLKP
jgi:hypothetical protein